MSRIWLVHDAAFCVCTCTRVPGKFMIIQYRYSYSNVSIACDDCIHGVRSFSVVKYAAAAATTHTRSNLNTETFCTTQHSIHSASRFFCENFDDDLEWTSGVENLYMTFHSTSKIILRRRQKTSFDISKYWFWETERLFSPYVPFRDQCSLSVK